MPNVCDKEDWYNSVDASSSDEIVISAISRENTPTDIVNNLVQLRNLILLFM